MWEYCCFIDLFESPLASTTVVAGLPGVHKKKEYGDFYTEYQSDLKTGLLLSLYDLSKRKWLTLQWTHLARAPLELHLVWDTEVIIGKCSKY